VLGIIARILDRTVYRTFAPVDDRDTDTFELGPGEPLREVFRSRSIGSNEREIQFGLHDRGKLDLRFFDGFLQRVIASLSLVRSMPDSRRNSPAT